MKKLVLFDFDGVLVNTMPLWFSIHKDVNGDLTYEQFQEMSHGNFEERMLGDIKNKLFAKHPQEQEKYKAGLELHSLAEVLKNQIELLSENYFISIVSSGSEETISNFLSRNNLKSYFVDILGIETSRNKTVKINKLLEKYLIAKENAVYVTDTLGDIREANESGIKSICVTWGLHDRKTLEKGNPAFIIDSPAELVEAVTKAVQ